MRYVTMAMVCASGLAASAQADEFHVPGQYPTIQAALAAASAGDEIVLADGVYSGAGNWNVSISKPVTIRSASGDASRTKLFGPGAVPGPRDPIPAFIVGTNIVIRGLTMRRFLGDEGAAMTIVGTGVLVADCVFDDNAASDPGSCSHSSAGAVSMFTGSQATFNSCVFRDNTAVSVCGSGDSGTGTGAALVARQADVEIVSCEFVGNHAAGITAAYGGAIVLSQSQAVIRDSRFAQNRSSGSYVSYGGAVYASADSQLDIIGSTFDGNACGSDFETALGGAVYSVGDRTSIVNSRFVGNRARGELNARGGAVYTSGDAGLANVMLERNVADNRSRCDVTSDGYSYGGGVYAVSGAMDLELCTFVENEAFCGGGVDAHADADMTISNSILWDSTAIGGDSLGVQVEYSDVRGGWPGAGNIDADPMLLPDGVPSAGSPVIDAGSVSLVPADDFDLDGDGDVDEPLPIDLTGLARIIDDPATADTGEGGPPVVDMGAIEFQDRSCPADLDGDGELTLFDFLAFQNAFDAGDPIADFDGDGELTIFDFLAFQNAFDVGCP